MYDLLKVCEDKIKGYRNPKGIMLHNLLSTKLQKECLTTELNANIKITKKNRELEQENEILKKAVAIFTKK